MKQTLYGFLEDDALILPATLDLTGASDQGFGSLSGEPLNYLVTRGTIGDGRTSRASILDSTKARGKMSVLFDQERFDVAILKKLSTSDNQHLFNIIERIYFQQNLSDDNVEKLLTSASDYLGYVVNSFIHSTDESTIVAYSEGNNPKNILVKHWIAFDFNITGVDEPVTFHIFLNKANFKKNYPFVTILRVTPPYDPELLVDPTTLVATVNTDILNNTSTFIFGQVDAELTARDQSGTYLFHTKYIINSQRSINIVFGITYSGANPPTSLECRAAIKDYLVNETSIAEEFLQPMFPELFIEARYYLLPLWDRYTDLVDREIYPSIWQPTTMIDVVHKLFPNYEESFLAEHLEIFTNAQNKMMSMVIPDRLNKEEHLSLLGEYDTYQDYSTQSTGWKYMPANVQDFAGKLIRCMAVASGDSASSDFDSATEGNLVFLVFLTEAAEFYLLTKDSYLAFMQEDA